MLIVGKSLPGGFLGRVVSKIDQFWGLFFRGCSPSPGSWFGNHPTRKTPLEGGFLIINVYIYIYIYVYMYVYLYKDTYTYINI